MRDFMNAVGATNEEVIEPVVDQVEELEEDFDGDAASFDVSRNDFGNVTTLDFKYDDVPAGKAILRRSGDDWLNVQVDIDPQFRDRRFDLFALRKAAEIADAEDRAVKKTVSLSNL